MFAELYFIKSISQAVFIHVLSLKGDAGTQDLFSFLYFKFSGVFQLKMEILLTISILKCVLTT